MVLNLLDKDSLINVCKNTANNINNHDEYNEDEKTFIKAANDYMVMVLESCIPIKVDIPAGEIN